MNIQFRHSIFMLQVDLDTLVVFGTAYLYKFIHGTCCHMCPTTWLGLSRNGVNSVGNRAPKFRGGYRDLSNSAGATFGLREGEFLDVGQWFLMLQNFWKLTSKPLKIDALVGSDEHFLSKMVPFLGDMFIFQDVIHVYWQEEVGGSL